MEDTMRRTIILLAALALIAAACGGDTAETTTTTSTSTTTTTTATTTTTTAPANTTTSAPVGDPITMLIAGLAGTYEGEWTNTTFGSSGSTSLSLALNDDGTVTLSMDLGGFVFGESDPDPEEFIIDPAAVSEGSTIESAVFGELSFSLGATGIQVDAPDVPSASIASMQVLATPTGNGFAGTYTITFEDGTGAEGTFFAEPAG